MFPNNGFCLKNVAWNYFLIQNNNNYTHRSGSVSLVWGDWTVCQGIKTITPWPIIVQILCEAANERPGNCFNWPDSRPWLMLEQDRSPDSPRAEQRCLQTRDRDEECHEKQSHYPNQASGFVALDQSVNQSAAVVKSCNLVPSQIFGGRGHSTCQKTKSNHVKVVLVFYARPQ